MLLKPRPLQQNIDQLVRWNTKPRPWRHTVGGNIPLTCYLWLILHWLKFSKRQLPIGHKHEGNKRCATRPPWLLQPKVPRLVKKFPSPFVEGKVQVLCSKEPATSVLVRTTSSQSILILSSHLCLGLVSGHFPSIKILYVWKMYVRPYHVLRLTILTG
jgi:hypothetical protein